MNEIKLTTIILMELRLHCLEIKSIYKIKTRFDTLIVLILKLKIYKENTDLERLKDWSH